MRGTLLNTATVAVGATVGWLIGKEVPAAYKEVALHGLGLVTCGIGLKMFLQSRNPLIAAVAIAAGGVLGMALGLHAAIESLAEWAKHQLGQGDSASFAEGVITSFVLFCVGPMTVLGCMQDALEKKQDILALKSTMDGIAAVFLTAAMGLGVLLTAALLLVFQGLLTLGARYLQPVADDAEALAELGATGGAILLGTGLGLLEIKDLHTANYLPSIFIAPAIVMIGRRLRATRPTSRPPAPE
ncbi:MAG TPA: DUF554 domain-containing protein [Fimbriimonas sp.]|nr:DUF554 domain-containing protein [Fimbriimonas sp.]